MRKTTLALKEVTIHGLPYFCVITPKPAGGRTRKFFRTQAEAETHFEKCKTAQENFGVAAFSMSEKLRVEAIECAEKLSEFGKTLRDATTFYVDHLTRVSGSKKVTDVIPELIAARKGDGCSPRYIGDLRVRLEKFREIFGDRMIAEVTAGEIDDWLRSLSVAGVTRNTFRRRLAVLFAFAKRRGYLAKNPVSEVERAKEKDKPVGILTVEETIRLLEKASPEMVPFWAIGAFAGLRRAELERLDWSEIDFKSHLIEVKASKSKTASRRLVTIQPNLRKWLAPYRGRTGAVCPLNLQRRINDDRDRAKLRQNWPQNALRHSFGSYHLARFKDAAKLALEMGNSPAMIFRHYRELVKPKEAASYWEIVPKKH